MLENLTQLKEQGENTWNNLDTKAKVIIVSAAIVSIIALLLLTNWASNPSYVTLFNNLNVEDAGAITTKLKEKQINYKIGNNGTSILVPAKKVHQLRLDLASEGLPTGGVVGFELFDKTRLGSTDFEQKVNFYRALSGELTRSIMHLDNVEFAKVQISAPKESLYLDEAKKAKASVLLKLKPYAELDLKQIKGITNLVASGVEGLKTNNVTVVDTKGNLLSAKLNQEGASSVSEFSSKRLKLEQQFENELQTALTTMLSRVLGPDNVVVRVNANLNFDKRKVQSKIYEPVVDGEGIVRSEESKQVTYSGEDASPQGVPGMESNVPQYKASEEQGTNYSQKESTINYEINEKVENYVQATGDVEKLSVAVMVNKDLSPPQKESIRQSVAATVGYNQTRGDQLTITSFKFDKSLEQEIANEMKAAEAADQKRWIIIGIIILIIIIIASLIIRNMMTNSKVEKESEIDVVVGDEPETESAATEEELSPEEKMRKEMKDEISQLMKKQPDEVARLLKTWLTED
ncbi:MULTISPECIES: flagellar basal-body MS-ring/collar protein FliF [unclassified Candidatus Frackibacter]|uniref:flagellar basal-body MS-ring/collar protein FliF n=1 Tax=unclassified Candidatus Frackibacter TaxID=2648818 RepID=UPI0008919553|nr:MULTISPECIES: flagellar basal-body MS-ring/collar protein FliF [unclassified Candidatus Frackibacter]SDB99699.1 flagellar M-ring protein FliF [Candidatus Frackibacter sp. WG11]SFL36271.1 flagellar M-ring protein FliF [Candidatus Frackibacter sp. WG13]